MVAGVTSKNVHTNPKPPYEDREGKQALKKSLPHFEKIIQHGPYPGQPVAWPTQKRPERKWIYRLENEAGQAVYLKAAKENAEVGAAEKLAMKVGQHFQCFASLFSPAHLLKQPLTVPHDSTESTLYGLLQNEASGKTLYRWMKDDKSEASQIPAIELARIAFAIYIMGMNDANLENLIIDVYKDGQTDTKEWVFKLIDNERCLSPSNQVVHWGLPYPFFRCGLLELPQTDRILNDKEIGQLRKWINEIQEDLPRLGTYLSKREEQLSSEGKKKLPNTFNRKMAWKALVERVEQLHMACQSSEQLSLRQLFCKANRDYQFHVGLLFACKCVRQKAKPNDSWNSQVKIGEAFSQSGYYNLKQMIETLSFHGDVKKIKEWAFDSSLSLSDYFTHIEKLVMDSDGKRTEENAQSAQELLLDIYQKAVPETLGLTDKANRINHMELFFFFLTRENFPCGGQTSDQIKALFAKSDRLTYACIRLLPEELLFLVFKDVLGKVHFLELDCISRPGFVKTLHKNEILETERYYTAAELSLACQKWPQVQKEKCKQELCGMLQKEGYVLVQNLHQSDKTFVIKENETGYPFFFLSDHKAHKYGLYDLYETKKREEIERKREEIARSYGFQLRKTHFNTLFSSPVDAQNFNEFAKIVKNDLSKPHRLAKYHKLGMECLGFDESFCKIDLIDSAEKFLVSEQKNTFLQNGEFYSAEFIHKALVFETIRTHLDAYIPGNWSIDVDWNIFIHIPNQTESFVQIDYWSRPGYFLPVPYGEYPSPFNQWLSLYDFLVELGHRF